MGFNVALWTFAFDIDELLIGACAKHCHKSAWNLIDLETSSLNHKHSVFSLNCATRQVISSASENIIEKRAAVHGDVILKVTQSSVQICHKNH